MRRVPGIRSWFRKPPRRGVEQSFVTGPMSRNWKRGVVHPPVLDLGAGPVAQGRVASAGPWRRIRSAT